MNITPTVKYGRGTNDSLIEDVVVVEFVVELVVLFVLLVAFV